MAAAARTSSTTRSSSSRSLSARMTAKVGPLPVWAWALAILVVGYLVYRHAGSSSSSSSTDTSSSDNATPAPPDTSGTPGPDVAGGATSSAGPDAGSLNDQLLSQLSGFGNSIDALTSAVLSSEAFLPGSGDSGSGSTVPNGQPTPPPSTKIVPPAGGSAHTTTTATTKPAPTLISEHGQGGGYTPTRYYTYAPNKAPKGKKSEEAPASVPGKKLHFAAGRGYYYA